MGVSGRAWEAQLDPPPTGQARSSPAPTPLPPPRPGGEVGAPGHEEMHSSFCCLFSSLEMKARVPSIMAAVWWAGGVCVRENRVTRNKETTRVLDAVTDQKPLRHEKTCKQGLPGLPIPPCKAGGGGVLAHSCGSLRRPSFQGAAGLEARGATPSQLCPAPPSAHSHCPLGSPSPAVAQEVWENKAEAPCPARGLVTLPLATPTGPQ